MEFSDYKLFSAEGLLSAHLIELDDCVIEKDKPISKSHISSLRRAGFESVYAYKLTEEDVNSETALHMLGVTICGENTIFNISDNGIAIIYAASQGVLSINKERLDRFNNFSDFVSIASSNNFFHVEKGQPIAALTIATPVLHNSDIEALQELVSGQGALVSVKEYNKKKFALIQTYMNKPEEQRLSEKQINIEGRLFLIGSEIVKTSQCKHNPTNIEEAIHQAMAYNPDIILISSDASTSSKDDIIPKAFNEAIAEVEFLGIPFYPCGDISLAYRKDGLPILALPTNIEKQPAEGLELIFRALSASIKLTPKDVRNIGMGALSKEFSKEKVDTSKLRDGFIKADGDDNNNIAGIILAAGRSLRMGNENKLLKEIDGKALILKIVNTAIKSKLTPIIVVTGDNHDKIAEALSDKDVMIIHNTDYRNGVKTSINIGLKAVPINISAAMLIPADMPEISKEHINKMIKAHKPNNKKEIIMSAYKGVKKNPIIWPRRLFNQSNLLPEDTHLRPAMLEFTDFTTLIEFSDEKESVDINTTGDFIRLSNYNI